MTVSTTGLHYLKRCVWLICLGCFLAAGSAYAAGSIRPPRNGTGWSYIHDEVPEQPWSIHVFKMERGRHDLEFCTTLGKGSVQGMATLSEQIKTLAPELGQPVAAVNGDFYFNPDSYPGDPRDVQIHLGELIS